MNKNLKTILEIRKARDWAQFHSPKNITISLVLEATEALELFQWSKDNNLPKEKIKDLGNELADVYYWLLLLSHDMGINIEEALEDKLKEIQKKYPISKSKGSSKKYTEL